MTGHPDEIIPPQGPDSVEAQLPAALVRHAQALEGMRRAHAELLARLDLGAEQQALVSTLAELRDATERMAAGQQRAARRLARTRRRLALVALALFLLTGVGAALAGWAARDTLGVDQAAGENLQAAMTDLTEHLDRQQLALQGQVDTITAQREAALRELADARQQVDDLSAEAADLRRRQDDLSAKASHERDLRLSEMGDAARLRQQLVATEQRLADLTRTIQGLSAEPPAPALATIDPSAGSETPGIVTTASAPGNLARRATSALQASGAAPVTLVEVEAVVDGTLTGLLLKIEDPDGGPTRVLRAASGEIVADGGITTLRMLDVTAPNGAPAPPELVPLPSLDRAAWEALGVRVPQGAISASRLARALGALVEPHGWRVAALEGCEGQTLAGVRLEMVDGNGIVTRALHAQHAVLRAGPELELTQGTLRVGTDERAFYQNVYRLPLPGADVAAWQAALVAETR